MYYIYHIPGRKIGCTKNYPARPASQSDNYELLEIHEDQDIASNREQILQDEYGYGKDGRTYNQAISAYNKSKDKWHAAGGKAAIESRMQDNKKWKDSLKNWHIEGGKTQGKINAESGHVSRIGKISAKSEKHPNKTITKCIHCGKESTLPLISRWHNDNCKQKDY